MSNENQSVYNVLHEQLVMESASAVLAAGALRRYEDDILFDVDWSDDCRRYELMAWIYGAEGDLPGARYNLTVYPLFSQSVRDKFKYTTHPGSNIYTFDETATVLSESCNGRAEEVLGYFDAVPRMKPEDIQERVATRLAFSAIARSADMQTLARQSTRTRRRWFGR